MPVVAGDGKVTGIEFSRNCMLTLARNQNWQEPRAGWANQTWPVLSTQCPVRKGKSHFSGGLQQHLNVQQPTGRDCNSKHYMSLAKLKAASQVKLLPFDSSTLPLTFTVWSGYRITSAWSWAKVKVQAHVRRTLCRHCERERFRVSVDGWKEQQGGTTSTSQRRAGLSSFSWGPDDVMYLSHLVPFQVWFWFMEVAEIHQVAKTPTFKRWHDADKNTSKRHHQPGIWPEEFRSYEVFFPLLLLTAPPSPPGFRRNPLCMLAVAKSIQQLSPLLG